MPVLAQVSKPNPRTGGQRHRRRSCAIRTPPHLMPSGHPLIKVADNAAACRPFFRRQRKRYFDDPDFPGKFDHAGLLDSEASGNIVPVAHACDRATRRRIRRSSRGRRAGCHFRHPARNAAHPGWPAGSRTGHPSVTSGFRTATAVARCCGLFAGPERKTGAEHVGRRHSRKPQPPLERVADGRTAPAQQAVEAAHKVRRPGGGRRRDLRQVRAAAESLSFHI